MIWPFDRASPDALTESACLVRAAWTATPWATGRSPERIDIVSGAGRRVTLRSFSALLIRAM
jgi:hypothetical protein